MTGGTGGILWPDLEAWGVEYLTRALAACQAIYPVATGVLVRNRVPTEREGDTWPASGRLVVVRDDGGPWQGDVRAVGRIGVQVWATTGEDATDLARLVVALLGAAEGDGPVRRAQPSRAYTVTDDEGRPKRYATAELLLRGDSLGVPIPPAPTP